tara:strand:- start:1362 stop:7616 length:6255 start_codon:yes stop_codon:yes gene_type:complete
MPYGLATIWNITSKYIYNNQNKNIGIGTTTPICSLDVYCNIAEKGIKLEDKYELKPENNKKYDLVVRENIYVDHNDLIIWYNFNKEDFKNNLTSNIDQSSQKYGNLTIKGTTSNLQKEYYVGTGSAEINESLYYKIKMDNNQFNSERYTFSFWLFLNEECSNDKYILNLTDSNGDIFYFKYQTDKLIIYNDTDNYIEYTCNLNKNEWYHISIIINDTSSPKLKELLVNGIKINHTTKVGNIQDTLLLRNLDSKEGIAYIYLGYTTGLTINGYIDDFRIYKTNLDIEYIQNYVIGNITKITPGHISANGNYGIDIVNYSSNINIGTSNTPIDLRIYGDLEVDGSLSIAELVINTSTFTTLNVVSNLTVSNNVNIDNNLTVSKTITENQRTLAQKYASISQIDKHTDVIISKMTDKEDVKILYNNMPKFFQSNLILAYDFDFNIYDIDDKTDFFINNILQLNYNTNPIYSTFSEYNITPNIFKDNPINYYGTKYVKGNSSLYCGSNIFNSGGIDYYSFNTKENYSFTQAQSYTIAFWIRFNEIDRKQHIFRFGVPDNFGNTERSINIFLDSNNNLNINITNRNEDYTNIINELELKKDEWYHIVLILKNDNTIDTIPKNIDTDSNLLIKYFVDLGYTNSTTQNSDIFSFTTTDNIATIFTYVNGIEINKKIYETNITIFGNDFNTTNYFGVFDHTTTTHYLNGYIDDFKMYQTVVPIDFINKNIIGDALIIKPEQLSAIGNYGINIKNFDNIVAIGNENNDVDLHIYGLLEIKETKLTISNCDIDVIDNVLTTSNFKILETLGTSNINVSNIVIDNLISGPNFHLGSSNFINDIEIITIHNSNLNSCNITADTITVNNQLILESAILSNITIVGIDIDETFSISNNDITIRSNLIIGDNSYNVNRYDLGILEQNVVTRIEDVNSNFINYYEIYSTYFSTITSTNDIQVFDKSIIFYGNTGTDNYDIQFKNNYIRDENCNIKDEINKSYFEGVDRDRTRIKLDVGNIKLQNGFIELTHQNILENNTISILTIEENQISITSNHNITILNDTLFLSNNEYHCLLTNSNFMFDNGYGFIDNETLKIKKIDIEDEIDITKINTNNTNSNTISIDTSNQHIIGKIRGHLCSNSIIDITDEIKTTSNITGINITASNLYTSNIICDYEINFKNYETISSNTTITKDKIKVNDLHIYGGITLGEESGTTDNNINGSFGTLNIKTIKTTNNNEEDFSIDTLSNTYLGKIRGCISSNSEIDIDGEIKTNSNITGIDITATNLYTSNIRNVGQDLCSIIGILESNSIIEINCNITTTQNIYCENQFTSNTLYASNIQGINDDLCTITGILQSNSIINITGSIETTSNIITSNITITDTLDSSNIIVSNITITDSGTGIYLTAQNTLYASNIQGLLEGDLCIIRGILEGDSIIEINCNITTTQNIHCENQFISNTLYASNIQGLLEGDLCSIRGILEGDSEINITGSITTLSNIEANNITITDTLDSSNIIVSNITISDRVTGTYLTAQNTLYASNIQGLLEGDLCSIKGILEGDSKININCNITTTQNIYCENQFTSNTLYALNIQSLLGDDLCSITGKLENNSEINITGIIKTLSNIEASNITITDTLDVSNIINSSINDYFITSSNSGIFVNKIKTNNNNDTDYSIDTLTDNYLGRIRAKLSDNSEIDINCNITTTADINANNITITNTLTVTNIENSDYITFNNDINAINQTITCDNLNCSNIISDITIKRNNKIIITDSSVNNSELIGIQIESNCIISYDNDETNYNKYIKINKAILSIKDGESNPESNVIYYENDKINIKCDELTVTKFNVGDGTMFSFPNIISYAKYEGDTLNIPNVYIGNNTGDNTIVKEEKDVLYIDTPGDTRLNTGNLLVRGLLEISPDSLESANINSLKIYTGNFIDESTEINSAPFTRFTTQDNVTILSFSLDTLSVGINVDPSTSDDNIKLFVDGGIQTTGDIIAFKSISDKRFKTNIISFDNNDIDIVNKLNPVRFIWKNNLFNSNMANKHDIGFIAQEVKEVIPEAVSMCKIEMNDIDYHYINYERIIPYLVNNIKYLNNKIVELENKLNGI